MGYAVSEACDSLFLFTGDVAMLRRFGLAVLLGAVMALGGCGGHSGEIKPKSESAEPKMTPQDAAAKAMQGMPPEYQKKMQQAMPQQK
jgi:hypothetical protein